LSEPQASLHETPPDASSAGNPKGPDFGSPFFGLPYFGEAKKGKSPAAATERHRKSEEHALDQSENNSEAGVFKVRAQIRHAFGVPCGCCASLRSEIAI
jgi:hypothetical protein